MNPSFRLKNGEVVIFDAENFTLSISSQNGEINRCSLGSAESRLLSLLLREPGVTKSHTEIFEYVWDNRIVASGSLNRAVFSLRNALNDSREQEIVMTVRRRGYRFNRSYLLEMGSSTPETAAPPVDRRQPSAFLRRLYRQSCSPLHSRMPLKKNKISGIMVGYILLLPVAVASWVHSDVLNPSKITTVTTLSRGVTLHVIGKDAAKTQLLSDIITTGLGHLPRKLNGQVWISLINSTYSLSCIRVDNRTLNIQYKNKVDTSRMVQKCLEQPL